MKKSTMASSLPPPPPPPPATTATTTVRSVHGTTATDAAAAAAAAVPVGRSSSRGGGDGGGWSAVFGCSYEGLELFRIALGSLLTAELLLRFRVLPVFYTDDGTMPLRLMLPKIDALYSLVCYHCHFGTLLEQQLLLAIQIIVAVCFTVGYKTKLTSILSFYMYTSLILRCTWLYFILDRYVYYLLFYSIFLPLDGSNNTNNNNNNNNKNTRGWCFFQQRQHNNENDDDNNNNSNRSSRASLSSWTSTANVFVNPATVALKLLVLWIYLDAGVGKYLDPKHGWTYAADPLPALDTYCRHTLVAQYVYTIFGPTGLRCLTPLVVYTEILCVPLAALGTYSNRHTLVYGVIYTMCGMHFGIALTIRNSYLLSSVAACVWLLFLPPSSVQQQKRIKTTINDNDTSNDSSDSGSSSSSSATTTATTSSSMYDKVGASITFILVIGMVGGNIWFETIGAGCGSVTESSRLIWSTLLQNRWNVFIGAEEYVTWEIAPGRLKDGSVVDVWGRTDIVNWNMPGSGAPCTSTSRPGRWRSFPYLLDDLTDDEEQALWGYLCREWDRNNNVASDNPGRQLLRFNFFMLQADVLPNMEFSSTRKRLVKSYECVKELHSDNDHSNNKDDDDDGDQEL